MNESKRGGGGQGIGEGHVSYPHFYKQLDDELVKAREGDGGQDRGRNKEKRMMAFWVQCCLLRASHSAE